MEPPKGISYDEAVRRGIARPDRLTEGRVQTAQEAAASQFAKQAEDRGIDPMAQLQNMMGMKDQQLTKLDRENGKLRDEITELKFELLNLYRRLTQ